MHMPDRTAKASRALSRLLLRLDVAVRRIPERASFRSCRLGKNRCCFLGPCKVAVSLEPDLNPGRSNLLSQAANRFRDPSARHVAGGAKLNRVTKHSDAWRLKRGRQVRHANTFLDPVLALLRIGEMKAATGIDARNHQAAISQQAFRGRQLCATKDGEFP